MTRHAYFLGWPLDRLRIVGGPGKGRSLDVDRRHEPRPPQVRVDCIAISIRRPDPGLATLRPRRAPMDEGRANAWTNAWW